MFKLLNVSSRPITVGGKKFIPHPGYSRRPQGKYVVTLDSLDKELIDLAVKDKFIVWTISSGRLLALSKEDLSSMLKDMVEVSAEGTETEPASMEEPHEVSNNVDAESSIEENPAEVSPSEDTENEQDTEAGQDTALTPEELSTLSYKDLQRIAKSMNLPAKGNRDEIIARIVEHVEVVDADSE